MNDCNVNKIWAATCQNQQNECEPSEDSDHPQPSLIRVFAVCTKKAWVLNYPLSAKRRLWSDWADAQADLSLRWAHSHFVGFVISRLILYCHSYNCKMYAWHCGPVAFIYLINSSLSVLSRLSLKRKVCLRALFPSTFSDRTKCTTWAYSIYTCNIHVSPCLRDISSWYYWKIVGFDVRPELYQHYLQMSRSTTHPTKSYFRPAKISPHIRAWSDSWLGTLWVAKDAKFLQAYSEVVDVQVDLSVCWADGSSWADGFVVLQLKC